jgi:hypothetical protein
LATAVLPASALAQAAAPPSTDTPSAPSTTPAQTSTGLGSFSGTAQAAPGPETVSGPVTLSTQSSTLLGRVLSVSGTASRADARGSVALQVITPTNDSWSTATTTTVNSHGGFVARWRASVLGVVGVRAIVTPRASSARSTRTRRQSRPAASQAAAVTVYSPALATIYGPGFYGQTTACGQVLTTSTLGVANRTLPCGTLVRFYYGGQLLDVPVIDRGPFANGATWDLTTAAASKLGVPGSEQVGTVVDGLMPVTASLGDPPGASPLTSVVAGGATAVP